jgi:hypothetical protein
MPTCDVSAAKLSPRSSAPCMWQRRKQRERRETPSRAVHHMMRRHPETVCSAALCPDCPVHNNTEERERERERERESTETGLTHVANMKVRDAARQTLDSLSIGRPRTPTLQQIPVRGRAVRQQGRRSHRLTQFVHDVCLCTPSDTTRKVETATGGVTRQPGARVSHVPRQSAPPA